MLLLDEPLGALDAKLRKALQLELKSIQERFGITFVYVTHDQEEALTMSDRIAVMSGGHVEQIATPEAMYEEPQTVFVADFLGVSNLMGVTASGPEGGACRTQLGEFSAPGVRRRDRPAGRDARRDPARARRDRAVRDVGREPRAGDDRPRRLPRRVGSARRPARDRATSCRRSSSATVRREKWTQGTAVQVVPPRRGAARPAAESRRSGSSGLAEEIARGARRRPLEAGAG